MQQNNILEEANKITSTDRQNDYGSPLDNFTHAANIFNSITGECMDAEKMAWALFAIKVSREQHKHKRDNMTDIAGYTWVLNEIIEEKQENDRQN